VLDIPGANGDATLRGLMNWDEIESNAIRSGIPVSSVLSHYQKLGQFRRDHPSVGAGIHLMISHEPYLFSRNFVSGAYTDKVVVGLDLEPGKKTIEVNSVFENGTRLFEYYSGSYVTVKNGVVQLNTEESTVLLGEK
jgi:alpha-amylase